MSLLLQLSNLLLLQIISDIDDNGDIVCLLLTCKKLYNNSSLKRSIRFKGIEVISGYGEISKKLKATATQFKLLSFKDIYENSIPYHHVILPADHQSDNQNDSLVEYPQWIQQRISIADRVDKSNITNVLVRDYQAKSIQSLYDEIPSIETLLFNKPNQTQLLLDLGSISLLPRLQRLGVYAHDAIIGPHPTLKSLDLYIDTKHSLIDLQLTKLVSLKQLTLTDAVSGIGNGLFPSSLTSLTLTLTELPPRDTFYSLKSLVTLYFRMDRNLTDTEVEHPFIDLENLSTLKTLSISDSNHSTQVVKSYISISVPPSIKFLNFWSICLKIMPTQSTTATTTILMPQLETLYVQQRSLIEDNICLGSCPSLKKIVIGNCFKPMPSNIIFPSTIERIGIDKQCEQECTILGQVVFPPSLTHLTIFGMSCESVQKLPESLVNLKQMINQSPESLPRDLKKLMLEVEWRAPLEHLELPSSCPPNLETLDLLQIKGNITINKIPPTIKYLSIVLPTKLNIGLNTSPVYSISSKITSIDITQPQWLPQNTTHLTINVNNATKYPLLFRLDQVINHTNVRYLSISISTAFLQFSIQRLDANNLNVLVLETKTLQGGIITQQRLKRKSINQQQQYDPIYLCCNISSTSPYEFKFTRCDPEIKTTQGWN
ncbi:hypothetical protein DFA_08413 [Cavenderia fasciculata]|uniref:Uncharacterized protein n=1 Tax=Cavenderia fasciculata TaxID=261658 RepID=F4Q609_CACFS|nr:uncharacterized protein DFA_08413 [Cavenderia fasciculata]EGG17418.1 hypothetical protein DFA_08413 [Cavenderia fasciculata]|eukprot:XP_004355902.1 hypothetical protein DFA_08413 [Cavenderia fasciculata]